MYTRTHIIEKLGTQRLDWHHELYNRVGREAISDRFNFIDASELQPNPDIEAKNLDAYFRAQHRTYWVEFKTEGLNHRLSVEKASSRGAYGFEWFSWAKGQKPFSRVDASNPKHSEMIAEIKTAIQTGTFAPMYSPGLLLSELPKKHVVSHINCYHQAYTLLDSCALQKYMLDNLERFDLFCEANDGYFTVGSIVPVEAVSEMAGSIILRTKIDLSTVK